MWVTKMTLLAGLVLSVPAAAQSGYYRQNPQEPPLGYQNPVVRDAFERGYQRGREDEARQQRFGHEQADPSDESRPVGRGRLLRNGYGSGGLSSGGLNSSGR